MVLSFVGFPDGSVGKESTCITGDTGDTGLIPGSGRSPGEGTGNLFQYSCLKNPTDRGAWRATAQRVASSQTWLSTRHTLSLNKEGPHLNANFQLPCPFLFTSHLPGRLKAVSTISMGRWWVVLTWGKAMSTHATGTHTCQILPSWDLVTQCYTLWFSVGKKKKKDSSNSTLEKHSWCLRDLLTVFYHHQSTKHSPLYTRLFFM